jgi:hypothetical protein
VKKSLEKARGIPVKSHKLGVLLKKRYREERDEEVFIYPEHPLIRVASPALILERFAPCEVGNDVALQPCCHARQYKPCEDPIDIMIDIHMFHLL